MSRRKFLKLVGGSALAAACGPALPVANHKSARPRDIRAVAFDLFTLFDPREVDRRVEELLPDVGGFAATWKTSLFEYSWIRTAAGEYVDFEQLVHDSLAYASRAKKVNIPKGARDRLEAAFTELAPWPDSAEVLRELKDRGLQLAPLANFAPNMIEKLLANAGLLDEFDVLISTDRARTYKPDPRAYALGQSVLALEKHQIAFSAFGSWDAAGARWYGYPTFWVNRLGATPEELVAADATGPDLRHLARWV